MRLSALAAVLVALSAAVLAENTIGGPVPAVAAWTFFAALCVLALRTGGVREWLLLIASLILGALMLRTDGGRAALPDALDFAAYFAAFITLLTALKIAAERSRSVLAVGRYLIRQPTGRRFAATATGGHVLGIFLNFGAVSLMAPLIQNATKHPDGTTDTALERRQLSALLRGFAWILLWAPTTLGQAILLTLFTDLDHGRIVVLGIATSVLMAGIGYLWDRREWRHLPPPPGDEPAPTTPWRGLAALAAVCGLLIGTTLALQAATGVTTALALMFVAPAVTLIWFALQRPPDRASSRFWPLLRANAPGLARSAVALGLSAFIGRCLVEVLPVATLTAQLDVAALPGWLFLAALPVLITLGGQVALSPIILVVFLAQVVQTIPDLPADITHIAFALSAGWALSMFTSPNATATLLIAAATDIPPTTLTWRWNLRYGAICYAAMVAIFALLEA